MSHFTTIETEVRDIAALRDACGEMGLALLDKAEARGFANARLKADHVVRLRGPYDIAVQRQNGSHALTTDWWDGHVEKEVGPNFGRLLQLYAVHKATREARKRGHRVTRRRATNGAIKLVLQGGAL